jgi:hypothetical protein
LFRLTHSHRFPRQQLRNFSIAFIQVTGDDRVLGAYHNTRRLEADFGTVRAKMTFGSRAFIGIDVNRIVGTGLHAGFATDAPLGTEIHNAILALVHRGHRADGYARRILAVIAACDLKNPPRVGIFTFFHVFHPGAVYAQGNVIFGFAGNGAGMAADALAVVDNEAVSH